MLHGVRVNVGNDEQPAGLFELRTRQTASCSQSFLLCPQLPASIELSKRSLLRRRQIIAQYISDVATAVV
jgi:hypothetical protein